MLETYLVRWLGGGMESSSFTSSRDAIVKSRRQALRIVANTQKRMMYL
jgi:hypothetical protein